MKTGRRHALFVSLLLFSLAASADAVAGQDERAEGRDEPFPRVVVTTTLLETALRELLGEGASITRLLPPGSCPGHFDIGPSDARALAGARLVVRHDYQAAMDAAFRATGVPPLHVLSVTSRPSFAIPTAFADLVAELAAALCERRLLQSAVLDARVAALTERAKRAEQLALERLAPYRGRKVLAAYYQRDFCRWAGLDVVAVFHAGADESAWQLSRAVDMAHTAGAVVVIGNRQWGERHLKALSEACRLPGIMLSNFPERGDAGAFWEFFESNVEALARGLP